MKYFLRLPPLSLERMKELNAKLNAFITLLPDAKSENPSGPLGGMTIGVKDLIDTAGVLTTAGSQIFKDRVPTEDAEVVARIKRAGAVIIGKTNTHEFAFGPNGAISYYGPARNPHNTELITGGSSSGSAAAVAAGMCDAALGTDTGGSIRIPASLCGVVGLKPTFDKVSAKGVIPLVPSLDHVGPLARDVATVAMLYEVLSGERVKWDSGRMFRVGIVRDYFFDALDPEIAASVENTIQKCSALGWDVREIKLPTRPDFDLYSTLGGYEVYLVHRHWLETCPEKYQPLTRERLALVAKIPREKYEAALSEAKRQRKEVQRVFENVDVLLSPTVPIQTPRIAAAMTDGFRPLLRNTSPFNMWGLPAISIPCGKTKAGMPIGLQLAAAKYQESLLLSAAAALEKDFNYKGLA